MDINRVLLFSARNLRRKIVYQRHLEININLGPLTAEKTKIEHVSMVIYGKRNTIVL